MTKSLAALCLVLLGYWIGWAAAHHMVADECRKLGGFFVGKSVFKCMEIDDGGRHD